MATPRTSTDRSTSAGGVHPRLGVDDLLTRGAIAGLVGGVVFILLNMYAAQNAGKPPIAPFLAISTIFRFSDMPMTEPMQVPVEVVLGIIIHLFNSVLFGVIFALFTPLLRSSWLLVVGGLVYGLLLYVVNFQIIGRLFFPFFVNPNGPPQLLELILHPLAYGLILVPFFLSVVRRTDASTA